MPLKPTVTFILYYISLLLTSPSFSLSLDYSTLFLWLPFTSSLLLVYLRRFLIVPVSMTFYLLTISDSRMFIVPILTWSIQNTVSVHWKFLVHCVATIHKRAPFKKIVSNSKIKWFHTSDIGFILPISLSQKSCLGRSNPPLVHYQ